MEILGFGINGPELVVLILVVAIVLGPKHMMSAVRGFVKVVAWLRFKFEEMKSQYPNALGEVGIEGLSTKDLSIDSLDPRNLIREAVNKELASMQKQIEQQVKAQQEMLAQAKAETAAAVAGASGNRDKDAAENPDTKDISAQASSGETLEKGNLKAAEIDTATLPETSPDGGERNDVEEES